MKLPTTFLCILIASCSVIAKPQKSSGVPVSINKIETHRVNDYLIRILKHNMELEPKVVLELFQPPEMNLKDYLSITSVKTAERLYSFKESDGVFVEDIKVNKGTVEITFEYYVPKSDAIRLDCKIPTSGKGFDPIACSRI
jgi:hypothetical protein